MARDQETVTERVVDAVASNTGREPLELPPLYDAIDPDALEALVGRMADGEIVFSYAGCEVTVANDGVTTVESAPTSGAEPVTSNC